ncbi:lipoyl(octanoyl) transferase LipB [Buchnera aphidicola (Pseudoregma panicola)]|uniref:lipoyl(octanoyl) transferase LipB n=1 Tax=Buchnera aphidicola TaxID=9 RepID=UPI0031B70973
MNIKKKIKNNKNKNFIFKDLGIKKWKNTFYNMKKFFKKKCVIDEIWLVEHPSVFTLGKNFYNKKYYITKKISMHFSNRGGGITYHGIGQQLVYFLIKLKNRKKIFLLIDIIKKIVIKTLKHFNINGYYNKKKPGIYVNKKKICSIGLCVKNGYSMHGFSLNVDMDLFPFKLIIPCNDNKIEMTKMKFYNKNILINNVKKILKKNIRLFMENFY